MTNAAVLIQNNLYEFYDQLAQTGGLTLEKGYQWSALKNEPGYWPGAIYRFGSSIISPDNAVGFAEKVTSGKLPDFLVAEEEGIAQTGPFLQKLGFHPFAAWKGMWLEQFNVQPVSFPELVNIEEITHDEDLEQWIKIVSTELLNSATIEKSLLKKLIVHPSFDAYLLKNNGIGVSSVMVFKSEESFGLYLIATAKSAQKKGFGRILITAVLARLAAEAKKPVILQATSAGEILYTKLGFVPANRFFLFRYLKNRT